MNHPATKVVIGRGLIGLCLIFASTNVRALAPSSRLDEVKAYLDKFGQAEMNAKIDEAFERTGEYRVLDSGVPTDPEAYGLMGDGTLVGSKDWDEDAGIWVFVREAKMLVMKDDRFPYKDAMANARVVAVRGLSYDGHYGGGGIYRDFPSAYIPWDMFEGLLERHARGDAGALLELADFLLHEVSEPLLAKEIETKEGMESSRARQKAHGLLVRYRSKKYPMVASGLGGALAKAGDNLRKEFELRDQATKIPQLPDGERSLEKSFGMRLQSVADAKFGAGKSGSAEAFARAFLEITGRSIDPATIRRWYKGKHKLQDEYTKDIERVLNFPVDILFFGRPIEEVIRDPKLSWQERWSMVARVRGVSQSRIPSVEPRLIGPHMALAKELRIDMNLVIYGKTAWERLKEVQDLPWQQRFGKLLAIMMLRKGLSPADVAAIAEVSPSVVEGWLKKEEIKQAPANAPLIARALGISRGVLLFGRQLSEEMDMETDRRQRVKKARFAVGLTTQALASRAGSVGRFALVQLENYDKDLSDTQWKELALAVQVTEQTLRGVIPTGGVVVPAASNLMQGSKLADSQPRKEWLLRAQILKQPTFGKRLRALRRFRGYGTQEELAAALAVTVQTVSLWERNRRYPRVEEMRGLKNLLYFSPDDLLFGKPLIQAMSDPKLTPLERLLMAALVLGDPMGDVLGSDSVLSEDEISQRAQQMGLDVSLVLRGGKAKMDRDYSTTESGEEVVMTYQQHEDIIDSFIAKAFEEGAVDAVSSDSEPARQIKSFLQWLGIVTPHKELLVHFARLLDPKGNDPPRVHVLYASQTNPMPVFEGKTIVGHAGDQGIYVFLRPGARWVSSRVSQRLVHEFGARLMMPHGDFNKVFEEAFVSWVKGERLGGALEVLTGMLKAAPTEIAMAQSMPKDDISGRDKASMASQAIAEEPLWTVPSYLGKYSPDEMKPILKEAFHVTGRYQVIVEGWSFDVKKHSRFGMGILNEEDDLPQLVDITGFMDALHRFFQDPYFPTALRLDLNTIRIVAVEGMPYDLYFGLGPKVEQDVMPTIYMPLDIFHSLFDRNRRGGDERELARDEIAFAVFFLSTKYFMARQFIAEGKDIHWENAVKRADDILRGEWQPTAPVLGEALWKKLKQAEGRLRAELELRDRVSQLARFEERFREVYHARGLSFPQDMGVDVAIWWEAMLKWERSFQQAIHQKPYPVLSAENIRRLEAALNFPIDVLLFGKPLVQALRDSKLDQRTRLQMVTMARGVQRSSISGLEGMSGEKPIWLAKMLSIDMNLVLHGKTVWERMTDFTVLPKKERLSAIIGALMLYRAITPQELVARVNAISHGKFSYRHREIQALLSGRGFRSLDKYRDLVQALGGAGLLASLEKEFLPDFVGITEEELREARGERVKAARLRKGITQEQLASAMGYRSHSIITALEKGAPYSIKDSQWPELAELLEEEEPWLRLGLRDMVIPTAPEDLQEALRGISDIEIAA